MALGRTFIGVEMSRIVRRSKKRRPVKQRGLGRSLSQRHVALESLEDRWLLAAGAPYTPPTNDPLYNEQWNLNNTGQTGGTPGADVNVLPAWQQGYTGQGVTVGVVDSGVYYQHPDLTANYNPSLSYDYFENVPNAEPPLGPLLDPVATGAQFGEDSHGTMVAGIIAGNGANGTGTLGEAPNATIASERIGFIDPNGDLVQGGDPVVASAFTNHNQQIDVFSNSWGYPPSGFFSGIQGPPDPLTIAAMQKDDMGQPLSSPPLPAGRGGLGNIFVFAAGNGGNQYGVQNTNDEAETASRFAITVAALGDDGKASLYSAKGASVLVSAPGGHDGFGAADENGIPSSSVIRVADPTQPSGYNYEATYTDNGTYGMNGTSAATPGVSGVVALMLQANPKLSWRDVQQILAESATKNDPTDPGNGTTDIGWFNNGFGYTSDGAIVPVNSQGNYAGTAPLPANVTVTPFHINDKYGFGEVNAGAAVTLAKNWTPLQPETSFTSNLVNVNTPIPKGVAAGVSQSVTFTGGLHVEHAEVVLNITHPVRGDIQVVLTSPNGTRSYLQEERTNEVNGTDVTADGYLNSSGVVVPNANYTNWSTSTVQDWGQSSAGTWTVTVSDVNYDDDPIKDVGTFDSFKLTLYGTSDYAPIAQDASLSTQENTATSLNLMAGTYDTDGTYQIAPGSLAVTQPADGTVTVNPQTGQVTYTPNPGFHGTDSFTYTVKDTNGVLSRAATVSVTVGVVLQGPVAGNVSTTTSYGTPVDIPVLNHVSDPSGTVVPSSVTIVTQPNLGTVSVNQTTGEVLYTPGPNFSIGDSFSYEVTDSNGKISNVATVTISLAQSAPVANNVVAPAADLNVTQEVDVLASVTGSANPTTVTILTPPQHGIAVVDPVTGIIAYTPAANFFGNDSLTFSVKNFQGLSSNPASVSLTVLGQGAPVALNHEFVLVPGQPVISGYRVLDNPTNSGTLTAKLVTPPTHGTVSLNADGTFTYIQGPNFTGLDTFTYQVNNGFADSNVATIRLVSQNFHFVEKLYQQLLNRGASDSDIMGFVNLLNAGVSRGQVASLFLNSNEYLANFVNSSYEHLLHRTVDPDGLSYWISEMQFGLPPEVFLAAVAASPEYIGLHGGTTAGQIAGFYQDFLNRGASAAEINYWVGLTNSGIPPAAIVLGFDTSPEYRDDLVSGYYATYLGNAPDPNYIAQYVAGLGAGFSRTAVQLMILSSNDYFTS
ncbi:MAG TPA: Ig-like domain-containing protein [Pirellulales bacterium]|nr:Ig-like domain-containing protein [Pirellulales bacterium]